MAKTAEILELQRGIRYAWCRKGDVIAMTVAPDMEPATFDQLISAFGSEHAKEMVRFGITRVPVDYFHYKEFRYTNLKDAIAQAERQQESG